MIEGGQNVLRFPRLFQGGTNRLTFAFRRRADLHRARREPCARSTNQDPPAEPEDQPAFAGLRRAPGDDSRRGAQEAGKSRVKDATRTFTSQRYQAVQVFYDKAGAVSAISIDFMSGANSIPQQRGSGL